MPMSNLTSQWDLPKVILRVQMTHSQNWVDSLKICTPAKRTRAPPVARMRPNSAGTHTGWPLGHPRRVTTENRMVDRFRTSTSKVQVPSPSRLKRPPCGALRWPASTGPSPLFMRICPPNPGGTFTRRCSKSSSYGWPPGFLCATGGPVAAPEFCT